MRSLSAARRLVGAVVLLVAATVCGAGPAAAHDELVDATPRAGSTVDRLPGQVSLVFDRPALADLSVVRVTGPGGRVLTSGSPAVAGTVVSVRTSGAAPAGAYRLAYRVVSADGHPVTGEWGFTVRTAGRASAADAADAPGSSGLPHGPGLLTLVLVVVAAAGSLLLRARVVRRANESEPLDEPVGR